MVRGPTIGAAEASITDVPAHSRTREPLAPATWITPQNGVWTDVIQFSRLGMDVAMLALLGLTGRATMANDELVQRQGLKHAGPRCMVMSMFQKVEVDSV